MLSRNVLYLLFPVLFLMACSAGRKGLENLTPIPKPITNLSPNQRLAAIFEEERKFSKERVWFRDTSPAAQQRRLSFYQGLLEKMEAINENKLSATDQINSEIFSFILNDQIQRIEFEDYLYPFNAEGGFFTDLTFGMLNFDFSNEGQYVSYLEMLSGFKKHVERNINLLKIGIQKNKTLPKVIAQKYRPLIQPFLKTTPVKSAFYEPFTKMPSNISSDRKSSLQRQAKGIIQDSVLVMFFQLDLFMQQTYLPACRESLGATALPDGPAYYDHLVSYFSTLDISPDQIYEVGLKEVERIKNDMDKVIAETGFKGSFADFLHFLRTDPQFYAKTPKELLMHASYLSKKIDGQLPNYFYKLPRLPYGVQPVPADIAPNYTGGRYSPGSVKGHRAGNYWVNTYKLESRPLYVLPALTLHEAVPGHHLQIALAQELEDLPDFRRSLYLSSYGEGWALYCEWLGIEMGIYETPYDRFGRMSYEMWRACRLVIDVGLHAKGWTREKAVEYMSTRTALSLHEVNTEIDRYIGWPGQALSYKIGELKIREWRQKAATEIGANFDLRDFHDLLLANGSVPLFILEDLVEEYIVANKN